MSKRTQPTDADEEARARSIFERCWFGPLGTLAFVIGFLAFIHGCSAAECSLAWDASPGATSYRIMVGIDCLATTTATTAIVNLPDNACTIAVVACNAAGQSAPATLRLSFIVDQESVDLRAWANLRAYYREHLPGRRFYRTRIETPP